MTDKLWLRIEGKHTLATALGADANHLRCHHHTELDSLAKDLQWAHKQNLRWRELYGDSASQYQENTHFVMDRCGTVLAAGSESHCMNYMRDGRVLVIRAESLEVTQ